jgi:hypothetical protein
MIGAKSETSPEWNGWRARPERAGVGREAAGRASKYQSTGLIQPFKVCFFIFL